MKLLMIQHAVTKGGKVRERGEIHDTQVDDRKSDKEAYDLISSGRALDLDTNEAQAEQKVIEKEKQDAEARAKAAARK